MSPIALLYVLLASPIFSEHLYHEKFPITNFGKNDLLERLTVSPFETSTSSPLNWLLRSKVFGRRSIISELFPSEEFSMFESTMPRNIRRNVEVIRRLAEVNPEMVEIAVEKLFRPESRLFVEKMLRTVEPESLLLVEKLIRKNVPTFIREKIVRRFVKDLIKSPFHASRRSILRELNPIEESIFSTPYSAYSPMFDELNVEPMNKIWIEKLLTRSEVPEVVLSKLVRKMIKKNIFSSPVEELLSTRTSSKSWLLRHIKKAVKVNELKALLKALYNVERVSPSTWTVRRLLEKVAFPESRMTRKVMKSMNPKSFCNMCMNMCMTPMTKYTMTPYTPTSMNMCMICEEVCPSWTWESPSSVYGKKHFSKKTLLKKLIKKLSKEERFLY